VDAAVTNQAKLAAWSAEQNKIFAKPPHWAHRLFFQLRRSRDGLPVPAQQVSHGRSWESVSDLKGKKIAVSNIGATDEIVSRFILQKGGLDPKKDVVILSVGGSEIRYQSLVSGQTDATALSLPHSLIAKQHGYRILGSAADALEIPFSGLGASVQKIQRQRDQVKRVIQAQMDTMRWIKTQKEEAVQFLKQHFGADEATAIESYNIYVPLIVDDVRVRPNLVKTVLEFEGAPTVSWDKVADPTLVEEVLQQRKGARQGNEMAEGPKRYRESFLKLRTKKSAC
jgi:ABC-type nitrate/sulfonate/bicarbonate transport system substrate-binding protein